EHFVEGVLDDIKNYKIFTHEIHSSSYAARVDDFGSYDRISMDMIKIPKITTLVGQGTIASDHSKISDSVIGEGCTIGSNVVIEGSYMWNDVPIEDGCKVSSLLWEDESSKPSNSSEVGVLGVPNLLFFEEEWRNSVAPFSVDNEDFYGDLEFKKELEETFMSAVHKGAELEHIFGLANELKQSYNKELSDCA
ncbi:hypothetical protein IFM89_000605, partial [Coptis chinensis]